MATTQLTTDFLSTFHISEVVEQKPRSGQKQVYIVKIEEQFVALKIIPYIDSRIERELQICEEFRDNPGIPSLIEIKDYEGESVILEEYIAGDGLHLIIDQYIGDSLKIRKLIYDIVNILTSVWDKKYVHRDLKPQNIIIRPDGSPVVLDFGIAYSVDGTVLTPSGVRLLTWPYGSPEQFFYKTDQITYRTDFFCLGIIAFYLYTGKFPFGNTEPAVAETFQGDQVTIHIEDEKMMLFLNAVLKFKVAERPRSIELFTKLLGL